MHQVHFIGCTSQQSMLFLIEILHPRPNRAFVVERPRLNNSEKSGVSRGRGGDKYTILIPPSVRQCLHTRMMHSWYLV